MKWKQDDVDVYGFQWAEQRRKALKRISPEKLMPWERIGPLKSTLAKVKDERIAAGGSGKINQHWPEVYTGMAYVVHWVLNNAADRQHLWAFHQYYVLKEDSVKLKAREMQVSVDQFWKLWNEAKIIVRTGIRLGVVKTPLSHSATQEVLSQNGMIGVQ